MYLLDTHAILFYVQGDERLSLVAREAMDFKKCFFSDASLWEIAIKQSVKKLAYKEPVPILKQTLFDEGFEMLPITEFDYERIKFLPFIHRDPFDRLLIAQALENDLTLITKDEKIQKYDVKTLW